jgi:predicted acetyltransferase
LRPQLVAPTTLVRSSYLAGEAAIALEARASADWLDDAARDFDAFVARRAAIRERWGVPVTELWLVDGERYLGTLIVRHALTPELRVAGGHVGYHVVPGERGRGHATLMLAGAVDLLCAAGLESILVTSAEGNAASRRVIERNGGRLLDTVSGVVRYEIAC